MQVHQDVDRLGSLQATGRPVRRGPGVNRGDGVVEPEIQVRPGEPRQVGAASRADARLEPDQARDRKARAALVIRRRVVPIESINPEPVAIFIRRNPLARLPPEPVLGQRQPADVPLGKLGEFEEVVRQRASPARRPAMFHIHQDQPEQGGGPVGMPNLGQVPGQVGLPVDEPSGIEGRDDLIDPSPFRVDHRAAHAGPPFPEKRGCLSPAPVRTTLGQEEATSTGPRQFPQGIGGNPGQLPCTRSSKSRGKSATLEIFLAET